MDPLSPDPAFACQALLMTLSGVSAGSRHWTTHSPQLSTSTSSVFSHPPYFLLLEENGRRSTWLLFTQANRPYSWSVVTPRSMNPSTLLLPVIVSQGWLSLLLYCPFFNLVIILVCLSPVSMSEIDYELLEDGPAVSLFL